MESAEAPKIHGKTRRRLVVRDSLKLAPQHAPSFRSYFAGRFQQQRKRRVSRDDSKLFKKCMEMIGQSAVDYVLVGEPDAGALYRLENGELYGQNTKAPKFLSPHPTVTIWKNRSRFYLDFGEGTLVPVEPIKPKTEMGKRDSSGRIGLRS